MYQGRKMAIFLYIILLRTFSHLWFFLSQCVCVCVCTHHTRPPTFLSFILNSSINLWCHIFAPHQNGKNELQRSNWVGRIKKMTSLQTWTCQKTILSSAPLCHQPGTLHSPWPLHAALVSYLLITICFMPPFITSPMCICVCCTCVIFKASIRVHFINSQVKERNSLASVISLIILNKVNTNIYMAFAQEEYQAWEFGAICSRFFWCMNYKVHAARRPSGRVLAVVGFSFPLRHKVKSLPTLPFSRFIQVRCRLLGEGCKYYWILFCPPIPTDSKQSKHSEKRHMLGSDWSGFKSYSATALVFSCHLTAQNSAAENNHHCICSSFYNMDTSSVDLIHGLSSHCTQLASWGGASWGEMSASCAFLSPSQQSQGLFHTMCLSTWSQHRVSPTGN